MPDKTLTNALPLLRFNISDRDFKRTTCSQRQNRPHSSLIIFLAVAVIASDASLTNAATWVGYQSGIGEGNPFTYASFFHGDNWADFNVAGAGEDALFDISNRERFNGPPTTVFFGDVNLPPYTTSGNTTFVPGGAASIKDLTVSEGSFNFMFDSNAPFTTANAFRDGTLAVNGWTVICELGSSDTASLTLQGRAFSPSHTDFSSDGALIAYGNDSHGALVLDDNVSAFVRITRVGWNGQGMLRVQNGSQLSTDFLGVGFTQETTVNGTGDVYVHDGGTITATSGAHVYRDSSLNISQHGTLRLEGGAYSNLNNLNVDGGGIVNVTNGGRIVSENAEVAGVIVNGTLAVSGSDTLVDVTHVAVGRGEILISDNAEVRAQNNFYFGTSETSGNNEASKLTIRSGGRLLASGVEFGPGEFNVESEGLFSFDGYLDITGVVNVRSGGSFVHSGIGTATASVDNGTLTVDGDETTFTVTGLHANNQAEILFDHGSVGHADRFSVLGDSRLKVSNGARFAAEDDVFVIGSVDLAGGAEVSTGSVLVGEILNGESLDGSLTISNGAVFQTTNTTATVFAQTVLNHFERGTRLTIENAGVFSYTGDLIFGGDARIQSGGHLELRKNVEYSPELNFGQPFGDISVFDGSLTASGANTLVHSYDITAAIGVPISVEAGAMMHAEGNLRIDGTLDVSDASVESQKVVQIGGTTASPGSLRLTNGAALQSLGQIQVGQDGASTLTITQGSVLRSRKGESLQTAGLIARFPESHGLARITGAGSLWDNVDGHLVVGFRGFGELEAVDGGEVRSINAQLGRESTANGIATIRGQDSRWTISENLFVGGSELAAAGNGEVVVKEGGLLSAGIGIRVWEKGRIEVDSQSAATIGSVADEPQEGGITIGTNGTLSGTGEIDANLYVESGALAPGTSPGTLMINGDVVVSPGGTLQLEIAGTSVGLFDQLAITGDLSIYGAIQLSLVDGYQPHSGDTFKFFDVGGALDLSSALFVLPAGLHLQDAGTGEFRVSVVPEPTTIALTGIPLLWVVSALRRRQPKGSPRTSNRAFIVASMLLPMLGTSECAFASDLVRTVALTGQSAPGADATFSDFRGKVWDDLPVALNEQGHVAFYAQVSGATIVESNDTGLWSEGGGNGLGIVAREGSVATGASVPFGDFTAGFFSDLVLNGKGDIAFRHEGYISTGNSIESGGANGLFYANHAGVVGTIAYRGGPAAFEDKMFSEVDIRSITSLAPPAASPVFNAAGTAAFVGVMRTGNGVTDDNRWGVWQYDRQGGLQLFIRAGASAPGTTENIWFFEPDIAINNQNEVAFRGRLGEFQQGAGSGIYVANADSELRGVARTGQPAPGTATTFNYLSAPSLNSGGHVAFFAGLNPDAGQTSNGAGIWRETAPNSLELVARTGDAAPGTQAFFSFDNADPELPGSNESGQMAFVSDLSGPEVSELNDTGIWKVNANGSLALVAREGDAAPGTAGVFAPYGLGGAFINGAGQVAFYGGISDGGLNPTNNFGIWAQALDGEVHLIAHTGGYLDVSDTPGITDLRQIVTLYSPLTFGSGNGRPSAFNDRGQIAFMAAFADGTSGVFVSNVVAIPEPAAVSLAAVAFGVILNRRSNRRRLRGHSRSNVATTL
jgi:T5SS/PEP-CTERM-associated repeat protein